MQYLLGRYRKYSCHQAYPNPPLARVSRLVRSISAPFYLHHPTMRYLINPSLVLIAFTFCRCGESDSADSISKDSYTKTLSKTYSPDGTKILMLKEHNWLGESWQTQVSIEFEKFGSGAGV